MGRSSGGTQPVSGTVSSIAGAPAVANVTDGFQSFAATTAATTLVTVPAGRTWSGWIVMSAACVNAAANAVAAQATGVISVAGAGATPAAGNWIELDALAGANAAAGTVGDGGNSAVAVPFSVVAPGGNSVTIQLASTQAGTTSKVSASAIGALI